MGKKKLRKKIKSISKKLVAIMEIVETTNNILTKVDDTLKENGL